MWWYTAQHTHTPFVCLQQSVKRAWMPDQHCSHMSEGAQWLVRNSPPRCDHFQRSTTMSQHRKATHTTPHTHHSTHTHTHTHTHTRTHTHTHLPSLPQLTSERTVVSTIPMWSFTAQGSTVTREVRRVTQSSRVLELLSLTWWLKAAMRMVTGGVRMTRGVLAHLLLGCGGDYSCAGDGEHSGQQRGPSWHAPLTLLEEKGLQLVKK